MNLALYLPESLGAATSVFLFADARDRRANLPTRNLTLFRSAAVFFRPIVHGTPTLFAEIARIFWSGRYDVIVRSIIQAL